jgi:hypothetical protein
MDMDAYADAIRLRGGLCPGHVVDVGRRENAGASVAKETSATVVRRPEGVALEESQRKQSVDEALDDALAGTFPASDPVALDVLR